MGALVSNELVNLKWINRVSYIYYDIYYVINMRGDFYGSQYEEPGLFPSPLGLEAS